MASVHRYRIRFDIRKSPDEPPGPDFNDFVLASDYDRLESELEKLNQMIRDTGYGQGQIDSYVDLAERYDRLVEVCRELMNAGCFYTSVVIDRRWIDAVNKALAIISEGGEKTTPLPQVQATPTTPQEPK